jgi:protein ImuA
LRTTKEPNDESFTVSPRSRQSVISLRFIYVEAGDDKAVLACFEEALRHRKLRAVVAEVARLPMTASRRLQLAAEGSGVIGLALRRWRRQVEAAEFRQLTASTTRWRVSALPSTPLPVPGVGRARWRLELLRCRGGESAEFEVEACDAQGRLALPAELAYRPGRATRAAHRGTYLDLSAGDLDLWRTAYRRQASVLIPERPSR